LGKGAGSLEKVINRDHSNMRTEMQESKNYKLGTTLKRFVAGLFDYSLILFFSFFMPILFGEQKAGEPETYSLTGWSALLPTLIWFVLTIGFEQLFGATLGNAIVNLKPVDVKGFNNKPDMLQSIQRHLLDPIDMFPFGIIGILLISNQRKKQRLGDLWANTIVVENNLE
jgi:uncharacterized RDD family membrane protein YckC